MTMLTAKHEAGWIVLLACALFQLGGVVWACRVLRNVDARAAKILHDPVRRYLFTFPWVLKADAVHSMRRRVRWHAIMVLLMASLLFCLFTRDLIESLSRKF